MQPLNYGSDPTSPHTTFVQADPSNFRSIVQKLTGAPDDPSAPKLPLTLPSRSSNKPPSCSSASASTSLPSEIGPRKPPPFKLHERRHRKLDQIQLTNSNRMVTFLLPSSSSLSPSSACYFSDMSPAHRLAPSPSSSTSPSHFGARRGYGGGGGVVVGEMTAMVSPVSPLDLFTSWVNPGSTTTQSLLSPSEHEERAIAEKGYYLHPSPRSTPRGAEPELLPLFPLHSPRDDERS